LQQFLDFYRLVKKRVCGGYQLITFWLEGQIAFSIWYIHTIFNITFYVGIIEINQGKRPK